MNKTRIRSSGTSLSEWSYKAATFLSLRLIALFTIVTSALVPSNSGFHSSMAWQSDSYEVSKERLICKLWSILLTASLFPQVLRQQVRSKLKWINVFSNGQCYPSKHNRNDPFLVEKREQLFIETDLLVPKMPEKNSKLYLLWSHFSVLDFYTIVYAGSLGILQNFFSSNATSFLRVHVWKNKNSKDFFHLWKDVLLCTVLIELTSTLQF